MLYGAYRRWKVPEMENETTGKPRKGDKSKGKKKSKNNPGDKFYNAIKNLGASNDDKVRILH